MPRCQLFCSCDRASLDPRAHPASVRAGSSPPWLCPGLPLPCVWHTPIEGTAPSRTLPSPCPTVSAAVGVRPGQQQLGQEPTFRQPFPPPSLLGSGFPSMGTVNSRHLSRQCGGGNRARPCWDCTVYRRNWSSQGEFALALDLTSLKRHLTQIHPDP